MKKCNLLPAIFLFSSFIAFAQVGIGTSSPSGSAALDITSNNKGFLPPRVTLTSTLDMSTIANPATGLLIFNTATAGVSPYSVSPGCYFFNGSIWKRISEVEATKEFAKTVYFNAATPTSGTVFDESNPATLNNNALKISDKNLYIGTDGSTWTYNPSTLSYSSYTYPPSTPIIFSVRKSSTQSIGSGTSTKTVVGYDPPIINTAGADAWNTNTGEFTIPKSGYYELSGKIGYDLGSFAINNQIAMQILIDGNSIVVTTFFPQATNTQNIPLNSERFITYLVQGAKVSLGTFHLESTARNLKSNANWNNLQINEIR